MSRRDHRSFAMYSTILLLIVCCTYVAEAFTLTRNVNLVDADQDATLGASAAQEVTGQVEVAQEKPASEAENATISIKNEDENINSTNNFTMTNNTSSRDNIINVIDDMAAVTVAAETGINEKTGENTTDLHTLQSSNENRSTVVDSVATSYPSLSVTTTGSGVNVKSSVQDLQTITNIENTSVKNNNTINATINEIDNLKQSPPNSNNEETSAKSMYVDQINFSDVVATRKYKTIERKKSSEVTTIAPATILTTVRSVLTTVYSSNLPEQNIENDKPDDLNDYLIYNITKNTTMENELKYEFQKEAETKNNLLAVNIGNAAESQIKLVEQTIMDNQVVVNQEIDQQSVDEQDTKVKQNSEDDTLSVQPIAGYKNRNSSIYAVKSTYKKPKKLEITQPKPYLRDPNDNSWRNQSINSLGIVFKANNVSKQFTLVSKNKTETESDHTLQKNESNLPELKERLEKLSEMRKSKKKKPNEAKVGEYEDVVYPYVASVLAIPVQGVVVQEAGGHDVSDLPPTNLELLKENYKTSTPALEVHNKPVVNFFDDFEALVNEEMQSMELNKSTTTTTPPNVITSPREPTMQHFPSRETTKPAYDVNFYNKVNEYTPELEIDNFPISLPPIKSNPKYVPAHVPQGDSYSTEPPHTAYSIVNNEGSFNRDSFVVKHFRDFVDENQRVRYDKNSEGTAAPPVNEYVDKYADSLRVATVYPLLYNNSIVHKTAEGNKVIAASTAYMKRIYGSESPYVPATSKLCEPDCDKITVELSPDYELHYYVPEQEEIREIERSPSTVVYHDLKNVHEMRFYNRDGL